jgi:dTDP-4-dehydrorhamnose reductase
MKIAVIGANGQLGTDIVRAFAQNGDDVCALTHANIEKANLDSVSRKLQELRPQIVVNTAAMHHVERCEQAPETACAVNALGSRNLALAAREIDAVLMQINTDCVFDRGKRSSYEEGDPPGL